MYIHYGTDHFDPNRVLETREEILAKPDMGIWACDENAKSTWREWCLQEDFHTERLNKYFEFELSGRARILHVRKFEDLMPYLIKANIVDMRLWGPILNRRQMYQDYDGLEMHFSQLPRVSRQLLQVYDCDSICIWNPNVIIPEKR